MKLFAWLLVLVDVAGAQTLTGPASVTVGDPVFLRLATGITPVAGVQVRVIAPATELGTVAAGTLTFRDSPAGPPKGVLYRGDRLLIKSQTGDGWCEVIVAHGGSGYVACDYLDRQPYGQPLGTTDIDGRIVVPAFAIVPGPITLAAGNATTTIAVNPIAEDTTAAIAPAITYRTRRWIKDNDGPFTMHIIEVDPNEPNVFALPTRARDKAVALEKTSSIAQRYGAIAAVNGAPFATDGTSLASYQLDGQAISTSTPRTALIRCADGSLLIDRTATCSVKDLVAAGPTLVVDNRVNIGNDGFGNDRLRLPRTAFAITTRGTWLFVTVDGRQAASVGMRLDEFAAELVALGANRAINLDGGSSTTLVVDDTVRNTPADGTERPVSDVILILSVHDLESLRHLMDRIALDPGQISPQAIEPLYQHYDKATAAFAAEELDQVRIEIEALRGEIQQRSGNEITRAAARALIEATNAYLRLLPGIQQTLTRQPIHK